MPKYYLKLVNPQDIKPDENNPRGDPPEIIENDPEFIRLKDSVYEFGVLVPLIVRKCPGEDDKYILIDGERRLRASWATNLRQVPVHVVEKGASNSDQLIRAFQIHMLRKQWSKIAQARSLKMIVEQIKKENPKISKADLFDIIQEKTGYTDPSLKDLLRILKYSNKILEEIDEAKSLLRISHLVQFEASIIEPMERHYKELLQELGGKFVREQLIEKTRMGIIYSTRDLMENIYPLYQRAKSSAQQNFLKNKLRDFIQNVDLTTFDIVKDYELNYPSNTEDYKKIIDEISDKIDYTKSLLISLDPTELKSYTLLNKEVKSKLKSFIKFAEKFMERLK